MNKLSLLSAILFLTATFSFAEKPDEGMYPISELKKIGLEDKGLRIPVDAIFSTEAISLSDAIVNIGGCTGSFISADGLILTNHHCAFRSAQSASTTENDYVKNGYAAQERNRELQAKGYTVKITEQFADVSEEVLSVLQEGMTGAERSKAIERKQKEIIKAAEEANPGKRAEVSEMFIGKSYMLFIYTYIKDVRLVYIPPVSVGNFGGENDNWMWPRHTADFAIMRAYVGPDGEPAEYAEDNVPYKPRKHLQINPNGVAKEDFVMILGYPGRTYRHRTSYYLNFQESVRMPYVADWYSWQIALMEERSKLDPALAIKLSSKIKGLANTMKNYKGKLKGLSRIQLVKEWQKKEKELAEYIADDDERNVKYGDLLPTIKTYYENAEKRYEREAFLGYFNRSPFLFSFAYQVLKSAEERQKPDMERDSWYMDRNFDRLKRYVGMSARNYDEETDQLILTELLKKAYALAEDQKITQIEDLFGKEWNEIFIADKIAEIYANSRLLKSPDIDVMLGQNPADLDIENDSALRLMNSLMLLYKEIAEQNKERSGIIDELHSRLIEVKRAFEDENFIPDANGTYRISYGYIRGYEPRDAVFMEPFTTVEGLLQKETGESPFVVPDKLKQLIQAKDYGKFTHPELKSISTCILYNLDTTGGNSGSPVLNAKGELIGLNFDRAFEATINDFAWNESYSRSIGVDIRYVLWLLEKYAEADYLLEEMGIEK